MRRRESAVQEQKPSAAERTLPMFNQAAPAPTISQPTPSPTAASIPGKATEPKLSVDQFGLVFIKCPACGLKQSDGTARKSQDGTWHCVRCECDLDVTVEEVQEFRKANKPADARPGPAPKPVEIPPPEARPAPPPAKAQEFPQEDISAFTNSLRVLGFELSMITAAGWGPDARKQVREWLATKPSPWACEPPAVLKDVPRRGPPQASKAEPAREQNAVSKEGNAARASGGPRGEPRPAEQRGPAPPAPGTTVTVTWGGEKYTPIPGSYSTTEVGPFTVTAQVQPGESVAEVVRRVHAELDACASAIVSKKVEAFSASLRRIAEVQRKGP